MSNLISALPWIAPGLLLFFVFVHLPILLQVGISLGGDAIGETSRIGLHNYAELLQDRRFWRALLHKRPLCRGLGRRQDRALLRAGPGVDGAFRGRAFFRAVFFLPVVISFVAIGTVWGFMLQYQHGAINVALRALGLDGIALDWLGDPQIAMWSIIFVDIWKWTGFHVVIYLAGLASLPRDVYESAELDGAGLSRASGT